MIAIGLILTGFTFTQIIISIYFGYKGDFEASKESEKVALLYLIATLICLK